MPQLLTREEALAAIDKTTVAGSCLVCNLLEQHSTQVLHRGMYATVLLSAYPRFWGQTMICLHRHIERFEEVQAAEWEEISKLTLHYAKKLEAMLEPARVYVAALGNVQPLLHTCPHLHVNLLPVYDGTLKPADVFTWANGVYTGTAEEWEELASQLEH